MCYNILRLGVILMLSFERFKILHSEIIMYCQLIENDLKWIYAYMHKGDEDDNYDKLEKTTLGTLVKKLKELDNSDNDLLISNDDYNFLKQMTKKRNFWCHQNFVEFMYEDNFLYSREYEKICLKLEKDHDRLSSVCDNVEKVKFKAIRAYSR